MNKLKLILRADQFWLWFLGGGLGVFAFETFLFGLWSLPVVGYRITYMNEPTLFDLIFAGVFAVVFGFGISLFVLAKKFNAATCAIGSGSGLLAFFTMLCPVCPVFFLTYFGLSSTVMIFAPYFWWMRLLSLVILFAGIFILWRSFEPREFPKADGHLLFQRIGILVIASLLILNQTMAMNIGRYMLGEDHDDMMVLSGDFSKDVATLVTPSQLPFYGVELGLDMSNLNAINASISKLATMAPMQGSHPIELTDDEMKRYVAIGTEPYVTCEFCCGVKTLVREDGSPTCGCAHSIAMRGTVAYLIRNYGEMTNAQIAYELMRQKGLYFPGQMQERMAKSLSGNIADVLPDIKYLIMNLSEQELIDLQKKAKSSGFKPEVNQEMIGGC